MQLGFALTQHCNLRCPHCIRDDVETVHSLAPELVERVVREAVELFGKVVVSFTGGEPTIHPEWDRIVGFLASAGVPYRFVTNGWHMKRLVPSLDRHPPYAVRLSLSGASEEIHDAERGRGSFRRVLLAVGLLTVRRIPAALSLVIDRRDRHQLGEAAALAESLGVNRLHFILPQPVPGSAARDSDLPPAEWFTVRREVEALARVPGRRTAIQLDYGGPSEGEERVCDTFLLRRVSVDARGRLGVCCQLSEYGLNDADVVADLATTTLPDAWRQCEERIRALRDASRPRPHAPDAFDAFPCMRCARATGKTAWLAEYPRSPWAALATAPLPRLVTLRREPARSPARAAASTP